MAALVELVERHGFGIRVVPQHEHALSFVVQDEFLDYFRIAYDDGRTGIIDKHLPKIDYDLTANTEQPTNWFWQLFSTGKNLC